ncbi:MAG: hypothetical protein A3C80_01350 [Candidatus Ryanbacteria bacterium RIFCSPHIGHO2_02_FULL_45_43]|uniref:Histidine kinase/HSP90-like ATPase domain-containing protein n=1 Tax=Candidatus Ryanbacteria bacterium RIFCSPHIGHO2_01_45_13 TaxID=1802112 RepID=A0A1G2G195_9BACT|nr:MAG: hypothetical protein A2718_04195 [Candidatus Ryanbacteria bacterium RIFCSPHIGHO2_01_FULL_44_130]OGZ44094.1 MAG: hypothetical protein A2W41_00075 [Candidatus Ryanbacteria bacterium RIFCSPHIGHO2_01_45_13]OGZ48901.1 MAG: hypothetical protein A3C80_01350 [Candidatus Ryanbacteria bacterium RIFCSPHIGHO2_02_FULL_45_43]OGZ50946.1 MAG: hypothetical protein A3E55_02885 [Candidatus Ryanbacteria bacterium RIFCSPHIGHO2_12_FULL_44_20]OGZ51776.1 MAG: hypothetical protein A3A17_02230 [Candidatus Ryanba
MLGRRHFEFSITDLYQQFRRDPTMTKNQGTRLVLYISKEIVFAHHDEIWAESEGPGKGSSFFVRLKKTR